MGMVYTYHQTEPPGLEGSWKKTCDFPIKQPHMSASHFPFNINFGHATPSTTYRKTSYISQIEREIKCCRFQRSYPNKIVEAKCLATIKKLDAIALAEASIDTLNIDFISECNQDGFYTIQQRSR